MAAAAGNWIAASAACFLVLVPACSAPHGTPAALPERRPVAAQPARADPLEPLRAWESATRSRTDFAHAPPSDRAFGADPYVLRALKAAAGDPVRWVGALRGRSVLVLLDQSLHELARVPAPDSPTGLAVSGDGEVLSVGELSNFVARYRLRRGTLEPSGHIDLRGVRGLRDVAIGPEGVIYVVEEHDDRLIAFKPGSEADPSAPEGRVDAPACHGPTHVLRVGRSLLVDCLLDHAVLVRAVDERGFPEASGEVRIAHDGPLWGMDAVTDRGTLWLAVGGVENHPLDRTEGSFGFIDSFLTLYRVERGAADRLSDVNASELGLVTPKALKLVRRGTDELSLAVAGYGSDRLALLSWRDPHAGAEPTVQTLPVPPGSNALEALPGGGFAIANPLLDAWVRTGPDGAEVVRVEDNGSPRRTPESRLGEALFFTTLMAPWNRSDGRLSRFTCETCHFEGYVDGRTHRTGRGDVVATTKPLFGLFNNRPHFSRALDPDLTTMVDNEFRVAGSKSGHDSWFSIAPTDVPWLRYLDVPDETLEPEALRRALMTFFMKWSHRPNPSVVGRTHWSDLERAGAQVFLDRCESCHQARLVTDDASTRVPLERWESLVLSREGPIVWARASYEKTGVEPYVSDKGARVVSLRRLYKKFPYFTNGSAKDVGAVLDGVRVAPGPEPRFFHQHGPPGATALREDEKAALAAFIDLL